jgi:hypothetical protein
MVQFRVVLKTLGDSACVTVIQKTLLYGPSKNSRNLHRNSYGERAFTERAGEKTLFTKNPEWERNKPNK